MKTINEKIELIKSAPNMVDIGLILKLVSDEYLTKYSNEINPMPSGANYGDQCKWIKEAVKFYIADIHRDKLTLWNHIPERFNNTKLYKQLSVSQFLHH